MKTVKLLLSFLAVVLFASCAKTQSESYGTVDLSINQDQVLEDVTKSNVSDYTTLPSLDNFTVSIVDAAGGVFWSGLINDWDPETKLLAGEYTANASYGDLENEGFDKPYFEGTQTFTVAGDQITDVVIPVALGNTVVRVECTEIFKNYFKDYSFSLVRGSVELAKYVKGEDKAAFVDAYGLSITGKCTNEVGQVSSFSQELTGLAPTKAYTCLFDVDGVGGKTVTLSFNDTVETIDLGDIELN